MEGRGGVEDDGWAGHRGMEWYGGTDNGVRGARH